LQKVFFNLLERFTVFPDRLNMPGLLRRQIFITPIKYHKRIVSMSNNGSSPLVLWYNQLGMNDVDRVGGKNASLGEMITNLSGVGVSVPNGFATTADAFNQFLDQSGVNQRI